MKLDYTYLGDMELDRNLTIPDLGGPGILRSVVPTFGGIVHQYILVGVGQTLTLTADFDGERYRGTFLYGQKQSLEDWRDSGQQATLRYHDIEREVLVTAVNLEFSRQYSSNIPYDALMFGAVELIVVG